jgi:hypothetical protein
MGSSNSKSVSTYSFSFPSNEFSIHGIYPDDRQLLDGLRSIILRDEILDRVFEVIIALSLVKINLLNLFISVAIHG